MSGGNEHVDFFVSYTKDDADWAKWIAWELEEAGYTTVLQAWDFSPGANFVIEMQRAAALADRTIAVLTPAYLDSRFAQPEWAAAFAQDPTGAQKRLVPVRARPCDAEGLLSPLVHIDLVERSETEARELLLAGVGDGRAKPSRPPRFPGSAETAEPTAPAFPGGRAGIRRTRAPSRLFTGRTALLAQVEALLAADGGVVVLHGLGGVGKTQTAAQLVARTADRYDVVWWVRAEEEQARLADVAELGDALGLRASAEADPMAAVAAVLEWLAGHDGWLLVLDNAPDPESVAQLMPAGSGGRVLITSRHEGGWRALGEPVAVEVWQRDEAVAFLSQRSGDDDSAAAGRLAAALGDLPLALEQAAAYVDETRIGLAAYADRLRGYEQMLFEAQDGRNAGDTVATTWELAFQEVESDAKARLVVNVCALLAPDPIPERVIDALLGDAMERDRAMRAVLRYSLVTPAAAGVTMHRLVQQVARRRLVGAERAYALRHAYEAVAEVFPADSAAREQWPACVELLPHALVLLEHEEGPPRQRDVLQERLEAFHRARGEYQLARPLCEALCDTIERRCGATSVQLGAALNALAELQMRLGEWPEAERTCRRSLEIAMIRFGQQDFNTAVTLTNLGTVLKQVGDYEGARDVQQQALETLEALHGPDHPHLVSALSALSATLARLGQPDEAAALDQRALAIAERHPGHDPLELAIVFERLASGYMFDGKFDQAIVANRRAVELVEDLLGPDHVKLAPALSNLGVLFTLRGRPREGREHCERALAILRSVMPDDHYNVAVCLRQLVEITSSAGDREAAATYQRQRVDALARRLGPDDAEVAEARALLARLETDR